MSETPQQRYAKTSKGKAARLRAHKKWMAKPESGEVRRAGVRARYHRQRQMLADIKIQTGCCDCGYKGHATALDFDHKEPKLKSFSLSKAYGQYSDERLLAEVAKCDVRCANCHRVRTFEQ